MRMSDAEKSARYRAKNREKVRLSNNAYYQKEENRAKRRAYALAFTRRAKKAAYDMLGAECVKCGFSDMRALQIDHIEGKGHKHRKTITRNFYKVVLEETLRGENKYQVLCANCNWIKRVENNEYKEQS